MQHEHHRAYTFVTRDSSDLEATVPSQSDTCRGENKQAEW